MRKVLIVVGCLLAAFAFAPPAQAVPIIDFGPDGATGTVMVTDTAVSGSGLVFMTMQLQDTPVTGAKPVNYHVVGTLEFDSQSDPPNFVLTGYIPSQGVNGDPFFTPIGSEGSPVTLLSGTIMSWTWDPEHSLLLISGPDTKNPALLSVLGLTGTVWEYAAFDLYGNASGEPDTFRATSYDLRNTAVPEPGSMLLLGTGLLGLASAVRRRLRR